MTNKLVNESSPYLLQHADNPVDWYPWGEEALQKAAREDKPIFLSIGYAACHWCHVMAHESFEDVGIAALLNEHFVNIKVDREERPELDTIYMTAVIAMTGQGGWPLSVFLTPQGEPFFGGTYFPPERRYQLPSFKEVISSVIRVWKTDRQQLLRSGQQLREHIEAALSMPEVGAEIVQDDLHQAVIRLAQSYDWKHGGWGSAPKFPQPMAIEFLLSRAARGDKLAGDMAFHALNAMAKGGMYDMVGGGFSRYSTDNDWKIPHFEKMLYDNAQLALAYLHAYLISGNSFFRHICQETLAFIQREMTHPLGGFYSSLDADSEGEEGRYYTWTHGEICDALQGETHLDLYLAAYNVTEQGNFEGRNVLQRTRSDDELSEQFHLPSQQVDAILRRYNRQLLEVRQSRVRPGTDDKIITMWNCLAVIAFAEAGRYLDNSYTTMAIRNVEFLINHLYRDGRILRSWRDGKTSSHGFLEDTAAFIMGLIALYQTDPDPRWFELADHLTHKMIEQFRHPQVGFYETWDDYDPVIFRPVVLQDNATPCGNSLAAHALLRMYHYTAKDEWREIAEKTLKMVFGDATRYPLAFSYWLCAVELDLQPTTEAVVLGDLNDPRTKALQWVLWEQYRPGLIAAISNLPLSKAAPPLLRGRSLLNGLPTAFVCRNFTCNQPTNQVDQLRAQLTQANA